METVKNSELSEEQGVPRRMGVGVTSAQRLCKDVDSCLKSRMHKALGVSREPLEWGGEETWFRVVYGRDVVRRRSDEMRWKTQTWAVNEFGGGAVYVRLERRAKSLGVNVMTQKINTCEMRISHFSGVITTS